VVSTNSAEAWCRERFQKHVTGLLRRVAFGGDWLISVFFLQKKLAAMAELKRGLMQNLLDYLLDTKT